MRNIEEEEQANAVRKIPNLETVNKLFGLRRIASGKFVRDPQFGVGGSSCEWPGNK